MKPVNLCVICKGKGLCGKPCPILRKTAFARKIKPGSTIFGSSPPAVFVGRYGYPKVNAGILAPTSVDDDAWKLDSPEFWAKERLGITELIGMRSSLVNSNFSANVKRPQKLMDVFKELTLAERPADVEIKVGKVHADLQFSSFFAPLGPTAQLKTAVLTENPKIPEKVDFIVGERIPATEALVELYSKGYGTTYLTRLLSAGLLGRANRMVPTRWGITAVDDTLSKDLLERIKTYREIDRVEIYHHEYLDNDYHIVLFPRKWSFEQLEAYSETVWGSAVISDHEFFHGRKDYASDVTGAYYAARLAIAESLSERRRQAAALVVRTIGKGYFAPLGVWQIRENVRAALRQKPVTFDTEKLALDYLASKSRIGGKAVTESRLVREWKQQLTLASF